MKKVCPKCGKFFECSESINCWCSEVQVSSTTKETLKQNYSGCLCKECLNIVEMASKKNLQYKK
jgi:ribosomal protein L34E